MHDKEQAASILYPDDQPKGPVAVPQWQVVERDAATARLMGAGRRVAEREDVAAALYPDEQAKSAGEANDQGTDPAEARYPDEGQPEGTFQEGAVGSFFTQHALSALQDGDRTRADDLQAASQALVSDAKHHGSAAEDVAEALKVVNEASGDNLPPEVHEERRTAAMATLEAEMGGNLPADLSRAQRFIRDLDKLIPGTIASLERSGAGNDVRLIKIAVKEAKRRGY